MLRLIGRHGKIAFRRLSILEGCRELLERGTSLSNKVGESELRQVEMLLKLQRRILARAL